MKLLIKKTVKKFIILMVSMIFIIGGCSKITEAPTNKPQDSAIIRGVWITHVGNAFYCYTGQLDNVFHQLSSLNFNTVYLSVYNDGVTYPSKVSHRNQETNLPLVNTLNSAIHQGKRQGLKIHGWFEYGLMLHANDSLAKQHPEWLLGNGKQVNGFVWLNPANPEVEKYFVKLFTEFAYLYYKLDGIQLDDHWSVPTQFGNYSTSLTKLTAKISQTVKKINPNWVISLSPNPPHFAYHKYSQDWLTWVRQGYIDEVVVQVYRPTIKEVKATLLHSGLQEASKYVPVAVGIFAGFNGRGFEIKSLSEVAKQVETVVNQGYGYSLFTYEYTFSFVRLMKRKTKESFFEFINK